MKTLKTPIELLTESNDALMKDTAAVDESSKVKILDRPRVRLPGLDAELIPFYQELGAALASPNSNIYQKNDRIFIAEILKIDSKQQARLRAPNTTSFCEDVEKNVMIVKAYYKQNTPKQKSTDGVDEVDGKIIPMDALEPEAEEEEAPRKKTERRVRLPDKLAHKALESVTLKSRLREICTAEQVLLPVIGEDGKLIKLNSGYDASAKAFSADSVSYNTDMTLDAAKVVLDEWFGQFIFGDSGRSKALLIALAISEFTKYLMPVDVSRPVVITQCNAVGGGKTFALQMAMGAVHGLVAVMSYPKSGEELRKKVAAEFENTGRLLTFDNVEGYINSDVLCQIVSSPRYKDRILGTSNSSEWLHQSQIMISGNNIRIGPDLARRSLICDLRQTAERPELRLVKNPFSGTMLEDNRPILLAALWSLTANWIKAGKPTGSTVLGSFVDWSKTVGGIVCAAGYADPCEIVSVADVDANGNDARTLISAIAAGIGGFGPAIDAKSGLTAGKIREFMMTEELFDSQLGGVKSINSVASTAGKILITWVGRDCAGYRLKHDINTNTARRKYWVEKIGE